MWLLGNNADFSLLDLMHCALYPVNVRTALDRRFGMVQKKCFEHCGVTFAQVFRKVQYIG